MQSLYVWIRSPVLIGNNSSFHLLMILANSNGKPGSKLAVVECVHHTKNLTLVKAQPIRRLFFVLKVGPDVEGVAHIRLNDPPIHLTAKDK